MCYKQKCKVVSLNLAHPVHTEYKHMGELDSMAVNCTHSCSR